MGLQLLGRAVLVGDGLVQVRCRVHQLLEGGRVEVQTFGRTLFDVFLCELSVEIGEVEQMPIGESALPVAYDHALQLCEGPQVSVGQDVPKVDEAFRTIEIRPLDLLVDQDVVVALRSLLRKGFEQGDRSS